MTDRTCPNGHRSDWDDYCSQCGAQIESAKSGVSAGSDAAGVASADAATSPPTPVDAAATGAIETTPAALGETNGGTCPSCGARCMVTDLFCEACGADLAGAGDIAHTPASSATASALTTIGQIELAVDREYFDRFVDAGQLAFPDPAPTPTTLPITKDELLVGRRSGSRGVYPDFDAEQITGDPAVSHRHLLLTRGPDGAWSATDQGSTNGSRLGDELETMAPGRVYPLAIGDVIHVGAWTAVRLR